MILNKRNITLGIIVILFGMGIISGVSNIPAKEIFESKTETLEFIHVFSEPKFVENGEFIEIIIEETNTYTNYDGSPMIPVFSKIYEFQMGTKITDIKITFPKVKTMNIEKQIKPVPTKQMISKVIIAKEGILNQEVYSSNNLYPKEWFSYNIGTGLNNNNIHVTFLSLHIYPVRYLPGENSLEYIEQIEVNITYIEPEIIKTNFDTYDLVIIAPLEFSDKLGSLIHHKENYGLKTNLVILEDIYNDYSGRDNAEKIKYFIKQAVEEWGTKYVLLVGNIKKLPIRTTYASPWEPDLLSDLYYADIYDENFSFCSWDGNENNLFGEVTFEGGFPPKWSNTDNVDLYADVHVGRIPCKNEFELDIMVNKIINYEINTSTQSWFKKIILAGGDTFPLRSHGLPFVYEGEITNRIVAQQLPDFTHIKLWASKRNLNAKTFNKEISKGAGFVSYSGHGFEHGWGTYPPNAIMNRMIFYYTMFLKGIKNNNKLPIIFFDACLTAKLDFNITDLKEYYPRFIRLLLVITDLKDDPSIFYPCFAWCFLNKDDGGAIATIGATRTAYTWVDKNGVYAGAGYLNVQFFNAYEEGVTVGEMLTKAQNEYINYIGRDFFTIEEFILLGDPSLKVGGYTN